MLVMELDAFGQNIYLLKDENEVQNISYWGMLQEYQSLTIMATILSEAISIYYDIPQPNFALLIHDCENYVGLQPAMLDEYSENDDLMDKFADFLDNVEDFSNGNENVEFDPENNRIVATDKPSLLQWLRDFCNAAKIDVHPEIYDNPQSIADELTDEMGEKYDWREIAEDALKLAWVVAALPEKAYGSRDELLKDVYRIRSNTAFGFDQAEAAITKEMFENQGKPVPQVLKQRDQGNTFKWH